LFCLTIDVFYSFFGGVLLMVRKLKRKEITKKAIHQERQFSLHRSYEDHECLPEEKHGLGGQHLRRLQV
jgi:hypothetical protein